MSAYRRFYFTCPDWDPGPPPSIEAQLGPPRRYASYNYPAPWRPRMCAFRNAEGQLLNETFYISTQVEVDRIRNNYRCATHDQPPIVHRQHAASERRRQQIITQSAMQVHFASEEGRRIVPTALPLPPEYEYVRNAPQLWITKRPTPRTLHNTW